MHQTILTLGVACLLALAPPAWGQGAPVMHYQLSAGPLASTLMQIARQSGQAIAVDPALVEGRQSPAITGELTAVEAVQQAIGHSELQLLQTGNGTLTLKRGEIMPDPAQADLPRVTVASRPATESLDSYIASQSSAATGLTLSPRETPQSLTVISRARMDDFRLGTINEVLANTSSITVEKVETERTYYTARGFEVTNFQFDGVGMPLTYGEQTGELDTAMFERIEVVRGANGLAASTGNPSATVNFVRKRPTREFQASAGLAVSSWDTRRLDVDLSGPLNDAGTVAGRIVAAHQEGNSWLDRYHPTRDLFYGVIDANLGRTTLLTLGHSIQKVHGQGAMWGALPLATADGSLTRLGVGTSSSANWTYYDSTETRSFAELTHKLGRDWQWKTTINANEIRSDSALLYLAGKLDPATGSGLSVYPSLFAGSNKQWFMDSNVTGKYDLGGRMHDVSAGLAWSRSKLDNGGRDTSAGYIPIAASQAFDGSFPYPVFDNTPTGSSYTDRRKTVYAATRLNLQDRVRLLLGANHTQADASGVADGASHALSQSAVSPYAGLVVDVGDTLSAYASTTKIFNPQTNVDINRATLAPATGRSVELGLKGEFLDGRLNASVAWFKVTQDNIADMAGSFDDGQAYYHGIHARSDGVEFELSGDLTRHWQVAVGLVDQRIRGDGDVAVRKYVPRRQLRLSGTWRVPGLEQLKLGASLIAQSQTRYNDSQSAYQGGYSVVNLMARFDIDRHLSVSFNLNNAFNKRYLTSVYWEQSYYAAPVNGSVAVNWKY